MKRIWFAIVFLIVSVALCTGEQCYVKQVHGNIGTKVEQAIEQLENEDKQQLKSSVKGIKEYWERYNNLLFALSDHGVLDDLGAKIRTMEASDEDIAAELSEVKALNEVFYENQKISVANVF